MALRIVFMGTPEFAVPALERLAAAGHELLVVTQPARPRGRGLHPAPSPVAARAAALGLPVLERATLRDEAASAPLAAFAPDLLVVVAFGLILRRRVLALPRLLPMNLHPSLLPRYRGVAPIQWTILAGDEETAVTTIRMDEGIDTGDLLLVERVAVAPREDHATLAARLAARGAELVVSTAAAAAAGTLTPCPQGEAGATYAPRFRKEHGHLDWTRPATWLDRQIRALSGWPGTRALLAGEAIEVLAAEPAIGHDAGADAPGTILAVAEAGLTVATGSGALLVRTVQPAGKRAMSAAAFGRGRRLAPGARFESLPGAREAAAELVAPEKRP